MIDRYTRPKLGQIFSLENKFDKWLDIELAVVDAWAELGEVPPNEANELRNKADFSVPRIQEIEEETGHDVIAFIENVSENAGDVARHLHKGLTSNDVVDTANGLLLKEAGEQILKEVDRLIETARQLALEHKYTLMAGRTHGVQAEPITFGLKALVWYSELRRQRSRLDRAFDQVSVGKISGAVGTYAHIEPELEEKVLDKLGLNRCEVTNQIVQRDRHANLMTTVANLAGTLEKIAVNVRSLQRSEIGEVFEPFGEKQKGSSAMPHKRNPIIAERITGLSRVIRGDALASLENIALWDERDVSNSSVERVALADGLTLIDYLTDKMNWLLQGLEVNEDQMKKNLEDTGGLIFSQRVLLHLIDKGLDRERAYELVQRNAKKTWEGGPSLMENLDRDREVMKHLRRHELSDLFKYDYYTEHVDEIFARCGLGGQTATRTGAKQEARRQAQASQAQPTPDDAPDHPSRGGENKIKSKSYEPDKSEQKQQPDGPELRTLLDELDGVSSMGQLKSMLAELRGSDYADISGSDRVSEEEKVKLRKSAEQRAAARKQKQKDRTSSEPEQKQRRATGGSAASQTEPSRPEPTEPEPVQSESSGSTEEAGQPEESGDEEEDSGSFWGV